MANFLKFLAKRSDNETPVYRTPRRSGNVMQQQIDAMISENQRVSRAINRRPVTPVVSSNWLEEACSTVLPKIPMSHSTPELGFLQLEQIKYQMDPERMRLVNALALAAIDICKRSKHYTDSLPDYPNRVLVTSQGEAVFIRYPIPEDRESDVSKKIETYLEGFSLANSKGHPLLSDRIPKKAVAIRWDGGGGVWYKRVRYLYTIKNYDYFLEYETGSILELRFDLTRFFYLPDSFDRDYSAMLACEVNYDEPAYDNFYSEIGRMIHHMKSKNPTAIVVGQQLTEDGEKKNGIFNRLPVFQKTIPPPPAGRRRTQSAEILKGMRKLSQ